MSSCERIINNLLEVLEVYCHPALRNRALADPSVMEARLFIGNYNNNLAWVVSSEELLRADTEIGTYHIVDELNNNVSLQFEDYVLAIATTKDIGNLKEQAEQDYIFRSKIIKKA